MLRKKEPVPTALRQKGGHQFTLAMIDRIKVTSVSEVSAVGKVKHKSKGTRVQSVSRSVSIHSVLILYSQMLECSNVHSMWRFIC